MLLPDLVETSTQVIESGEGVQSPRPRFFVVTRSGELCAHSMIRRLGGLQVFERAQVRLLPSQPHCARGVVCHQASLLPADFDVRGLSAFGFRLSAGASADS